MLIGAVVGTHHAAPADTADDSPMTSASQYRRKKGLLCNCMRTKSKQERKGQGTTQLALRLVFPFLLINLSVLDPGLVKLTHICIMFFQRQPYACTYSADAQPCMNVCVVLRVLGCEHDLAARSSRPSSQPQPRSRGVGRYVSMFTCMFQCDVCLHICLHVVCTYVCISLFGVL